MKKSTIGIFVGIGICILAISFIPGLVKYLVPPIDTSSEENGWEYHVLEIDTSVPQSSLQLNDGTYAIFGRNNDTCVVSFPKFGLKADSTSVDSSTLVPLEVIPNFEYVILNDIDIYGFYGSIGDLNYGRIMTLEQETGYFVWRLSELSYYSKFIIHSVYFSINQS